jgi:hypothetical protein
MFQLIYLYTKASQLPSEKRMGEPKSQSGYCKGEKSLDPAGN